MNEEAEGSVLPSHIISPSLMAQKQEADLLSATHPKCRDKSLLSGATTAQSVSQLLLSLTDCMIPSD